jgi:modulator of FtsH protease HflC
MRTSLRWILLSLAAIVLLAAARLCVFTVDRTEYVYVTQFGRHVATYDGADDADAGLHWKWPVPIQTLHRLDRRLQVFDLPGAELATHDPAARTIDKMLTLDAYVCWRITDKAAVDKFLRTMGTPEQAQAILGQHISSELGAAISQMELDDLISIEVGKVDRQREALRKRLLQACAAGTETQGNRAGHDYGIEVVDIRLRRTNHPPEVRQAIFQRIESERQRRVADYESAGKKRADDITSEARKKVLDLEADANAQATRIKGEADTEADRIRNEAHAKDPEFYAFLKKLEEYRHILADNKSMLLLSTHRDMFKLLFEPPPPQGKPAPPKTADASPEGSK